MTALELGLALIAGLLIGSFLNVCIYRLPRDLSVLKPTRSFCPGCEATIAWYDNIPLLSFALLRRRCRRCGQRIPWRYPLVEVATGGAFVLCVALFGATLEAVKYCLFSAILIDLIATDFEARILPDEFTLGGTLAGLAMSYWVPLPPDIAIFIAPGLDGTPWLSVVESAMGAGVVSGLILALGWLYEKIRGREGLGLGDVKMIMMIGAFLGMKLVLLTVIVGSILGSLVSPPLILVARIPVVRRWRRRWPRRGSAAGAACALIRRYELPFGSFLGLAALVMALWGSILEAWYGRLGT